jgi:hypothetical protein
MIFATDEHGYGGKDVTATATTATATATATATDQQPIRRRRICDSNKNLQQPSLTATAKGHVTQHSMIFAAAVIRKGPKVRKDLDGPNGKHRQVAAVK